MSAELIIPLPFRKMDSNTDWKSVKKFLVQHYKDEQVKTVTATLDRLNELRKHISQSCVRGTKQPPTEAFVEGYVKEYAGLVALAQRHLPICTGEVKGLQFAWIDCIDGKQKNSTNSNAELIGCVMNMAASYSYVAATEAAYKSVEGTKNGFKLFQLAAGLYNWIPSLTNRLTTNEVIGDFAPNVFSTFSQYSSAQAHHCSYLKAEIEMADKFPILSKLAMEAGKLYGAVEASFRSLGFKQGSEPLQCFCAAAQHVFTAKAHCHLGQAEFAKEEMGNAIGRYQEAMNALAQAEGAARADSGVMNWVRGVQDHIGGLLAVAQNKNDTVYFARVAKNLPPPESLGRAMGKPTAVEDVLTRPQGEPNPFKGIVPVHVSSVVSDYKTKMNEALMVASSTVIDYREKTQKNLEHLGVMQAISTAEAGDGKGKGQIPGALKNRIIGLRTDKNGDTFKLMDTLVNMLGHATNSAVAVENSINAIKEELYNEQQQDQNYLKTYGEKVWYSMRQPSNKLPDVVTLNKMVIELTSAVDIQIKQVKQKLTEQMQGQPLKDMARLDWPMEELDALMPFTESAASKNLSQAVLLGVEKLKTYVSRIQELEKEQGDLLKELTTMLSTENVTDLVAAVSAEKHSEVLDALTLEFNGKVSILKEKMEEGDKQVESSQEAMITLAEVKSDDPVADEAQRYISSLEQACTLYSRMHQQLGDLSTTASGLMDKAEGALGNARSFTLGRSVEAEDFASSLDRQVKEKMREVELKRQQSEELKDSEQRQKDLQAQIAALEAQNALAGGGNGSNGSNGQQQQQQQGSYDPNQQQQQNVLDAMAQDQRRQTMDSVFNPSPTSANPYVYQPPASNTAPPPAQAPAPARTGYTPPPQSINPAQPHGVPPQPTPGAYQYQQPPAQHQQQQQHQQQYSYPQQPGAAPPQPYQHHQPPPLSQETFAPQQQQNLYGGQHQQPPQPQTTSQYVYNPNQQTGAPPPPPPPSQPYQPAFGPPQ